MQNRSSNPYQISYRRRGRAPAAQESSSSDAAARGLVVAFEALEATEAEVAFVPYEVPEPEAAIVVAESEAVVTEAAVFAVAAALFEDPTLFAEPPAVEAWAAV